MGERLPIQISKRDDKAEFSNFDSNSIVNIMGKENQLTLDILFKLDFINKNTIQDMYKEMLYYKDQNNSSDFEYSWVIWNMIAAEFWYKDNGL